MPFKKTRAAILKDYEHSVALSGIAPEGPTRLVVVLDHLKPSFNVGKIYRSASAFGARAVHLVGIAPFDPSPAKGTMKQLRSKRFTQVQESIQMLQAEGYTCFALDPRASLALDQAQLPEKTAFILGHEEFGLSFQPEDEPAVQLLKIRQRGQVESLNVSVAASLAMYEYTRQHPAT